MTSLFHFLIAYAPVWFLMGIEAWIGWHLLFDDDRKGNN